MKHRVAATFFLLLLASLPAKADVFGGQQAQSEVTNPFPKDGYTLAFRTKGTSAYVDISFSVPFGQGVNEALTIALSERCDEKHFVNEANSVWAEPKSGIIENCSFSYFFPDRKHYGGSATLPVTFDAKAFAKLTQCFSSSFKITLKAKIAVTNEFGVDEEGTFSSPPLEVGSLAKPEALGSLCAATDDSKEDDAKDVDDQKMKTGTNDDKRGNSNLIVTTDKDGDGFADKIDACPDKPGTIDGCYQSTDTNRGTDTGSGTSKAPVGNTSGGACSFAAGAPVDPANFLPLLLFLPYFVRRGRGT